MPTLCSHYKAALNVLKSYELIQVVKRIGTSKWIYVPSLQYFDYDKQANSASVYLKPNSITLSGSELVRSCLRPASNQLRTSCSFLYFSRPLSEGWPHHGRTFSIYLYPLSFWLTLPQSPVHDLMLSIQAVRGLPRLRAPGIVPCMISFSRQFPCFLMVWP